MPTNIVSDTSCLILFRKIGEFELLKRVYGKIIITDAVTREFNRPVPKWIQIVTPESNLHKGLLNILGAGEASSISLVTEINDALLIIDEAKGRRIGKEMGLRVTGTLGVLVVAKKKGYIQAVKPIIEEIERTNFRVSKELVRSVLQKVNEE